MRPIVDPRQGDIEDDASSTKRRTLISLAGNLLAEISLPKLIAAWTMLIALPVLVLGVTPLLASIWISKISSKAAAIFTGLWPPILLALLGVVGWFDCVILPRGSCQPTPANIRGIECVPSAPRRRVC